MKSSSSSGTATRTFVGCWGTSHMCNESSFMESLLHSEQEKRPKGKVERDPCCASYVIIAPNGGDPNISLKILRFLFWAPPTELARMLGF